MINYDLYLPQKYTHIFHPVIVRLAKTYIITDKWVEVPDDIAELILEEAHKRRIKPFQTEIKKDKIFKVIGESGTEHTVKLINGIYSCDCKGYMFRHSCSHIDKIKEGKNITIPKDIKTYTWVSDTGKTKHKITCVDGVWKCSCSSKKSECKHIIEIKEKLSK